AISKFNEDHLVTTFPELDGRVVLIHNGLDLARFRYAEPEPVTGPLKVAAVGRLVEKKGFTHLVEAARVITARQTDGPTADAPAVEVRIAGDGELRAELAAQVTAAGLDDVVQLVGPRSQDEVRE